MLEPSTKKRFETAQEVLKMIPSDSRRVGVDDTRIIMQQSSINAKVGVCLGGIHMHTSLSLYTI